MSGAEKRLLRKRQAILDAAAEDSDEMDDDTGSEPDSDEEQDGDMVSQVSIDSSGLTDAGSELSDNLMTGESSDDDDDDEDDDEDEDEVEASDIAKQKRQKFRQWALQQTGVNLAPDLLALNKPYVEGPSTGPTLPKIGPLGETYSLPSTSLLTRDGTSSTSNAPRPSGPRPTMNRRPSVEEARQQLPVVAEEQTIMESILLHPVVVICGETGSGKTTQIPQMLYEAGFGFPGSDNPGMIAVTQPRRVAAVSLAVRVASELNQGLKSNLVAHQIRYSSTTSKDTAIKFMTDGVLLRELSTDFLLSRYSVVVVDEAHERGVNTDVLVGVLSRVAKLREKLWREKKDETKVRELCIAIDLPKLM